MYRCYSFGGRKLVSNSDNADVLILGAGAAGIAAARACTSAGLTVSILEARDRIGGRIFTVHNQKADVPIELGAEFVHGRPPEIFERIEDAHLPVQEVAGERWCSRRGTLKVCDNLENDFERIFRRMSRKAPDQSFSDFFSNCCHNESADLRAWMLAYIEGFESARPDQISVHSLIRENDAANKIDGDRAFRILTGYDSLLRTLAMQFRDDHCKLYLNAPVRTLRWSGGRVEAESARGTFRAPRAIVTIPLSILKDSEFDSGDTLRFVPDISAKRRPLSMLTMGPVIRVVLQFRERFWENIKVGVNGDQKDLSALSFLHSDASVFPTWWSTMPHRAPVLTGWSAGPRSEGLSFRKKEFVFEQATSTLAHLLHMPAAEIRDLTTAFHFHDWQADPYSRAAYSYALVGGYDAAQELAQPLNDTLYFAGEATDYTGHTGTVHGAIGSGYRAARQILESLQQRSSTKSPAA
jgi:monoamine oxidase